VAILTTAGHLVRITVILNCDNIFTKFYQSESPLLFIYRENKGNDIIHVLSLSLTRLRKRRSLCL